jgi:ribosomal protein S18 acetylase RimI-like enzyme
MTDFHNLVIEPLAVTHDKARFHCGVEALDQYIRKQAGQDIRRRINRVFVAKPLDHPRMVLGYYGLSSLSVELNQLPERSARMLPKHPIPAALIGRLAVSKTAQGHGIGRMLLVDAIKRTLAVSEQIAIHAMVVDAINDKAKSFYERFGFTPLCNDRPRLFLPLKSIEVT